MEKAITLNNAAVQQAFKEHVIKCIIETARGPMGLPGASMGTSIEAVATDFYNQIIKHNKNYKPHQLRDKLSYWVTGLGLDGYLFQCYDAYLFVEGLGLIQGGDYAKGYSIYHGQFMKHLYNIITSAPIWIKYQKEGLV